MQRVQTAGFEGSSPRRGPDEAAIPSPGTLYADISETLGELAVTFWSPLRLCNDLPFQLSCQLEGHQLDFGMPVIEAVDILPGMETPLVVSQTTNERLKLQLKTNKVGSRKTHSCSYNDLPCQKLRFMIGFGFGYLQI